jgi:hypothetical protein
MQPAVFFICAGSGHHSLHLPFIEETLSGTWRLRARDELSFAEPKAIGPRQLHLKTVRRFRLASGAAEDD